MHKVFGLVLATSLVMGVGQSAVSSESPVPPGVSADNWILLGDRAGFVITNGESLIGSTTAVGVARGYFMIRRGGIWLRIDTAPDPGGAGSEH
jgi:hypothetical protein